MSVEIDQSHAIMAKLATHVDWTKVNPAIAQERLVKNPDIGDAFAAWINNGCRLILPGHMIIMRDRGKIFNPAEFIGAGHTIWRGPANGNGLEGELDQDERSIALNEADLTKVRFETTLEKGEKVVNGEKRLIRLKAKNVIRLDAGLFAELWADKSKIPEQWKEKTNGNTTYVFFDGTILRCPHGNRYVLSLYWDGYAWYWLTYWLDSVFTVSNPSAVLAS